MDYCHPCRRHLNGALACPGCGAPVEDLRTYASEEASRTAPYEAYDEAEREPEPVEVGAAAEAARPGGRAASRRAAQGRRGRGEDDLQPEGEETAPEGGTGTSRRDRKAAAHRRRRRRTLMITAGFVLAAGGLSLAELGLDAPGSSPANPAAAGDVSADDDAEAGAGESEEPTSDVTDTATGAASPDASASPSPSKSEKDKESEKPEDKPTKETQSSATGGGAPDATAAPEPTKEDPAPTPTPDPTTAVPNPEPSETCTRFLWWCS
ncbi:SCO2400 family protein [Streptomyces cupreus]|uniref:Uncharacterized protein n=1 Tax=Streptomyces cupreus TaxID=2759956 RepID=A0A7X1M8E3_9ACTN|nr:hypothetical protein [Streptomyces cupreus]MBC2901493.1 hypothetical protein [Streptomyces cupreus]